MSAHDTITDVANYAPEMFDRLHEGREYPAVEVPLRSNLHELCGCGDCACGEITVAELMQARADIWAAR